MDERQSKAPRHQQLSDWLRANIEAGTFAVDEKLPSENELTRQFSLSRITVRRALQTVEHEGLIYRQQGVGSFVRGPRVQHGLVRLTDFVEDMAQSGIAASSRLISIRETAPPANVAALLDLDYTYVLPDIADKLTSYDLNTRSIYDILEREWDMPVTRGRYRLSAESALDEVAALLEVPKRTAALSIERVTYVSNERPVYVQQRWYRSDRVCYELELRRESAAARNLKHGMPLQRFGPAFR
ncbi:MAG: GntR family transcriptional regulator [Bacteroidetes bacterium]|nr:GntR family transcriptional regulator [Bacteroidota bacterium]